MASDVQGYTQRGGIWLLTERPEVPVSNDVSEASANIVAWAGNRVWFHRRGFVRRVVLC